MSVRNSEQKNEYYNDKKTNSKTFNDYYNEHEKSLLRDYDIPYSRYMTKEICEINGQKLFEYINGINETEPDIIKKEINEYSKLPVDIHILNYLRIKLLQEFDKDGTAIKYLLMSIRILEEIMSLLKELVYININHVIDDKYKK